MKTERLYIRIDPEKKRFLQKVADKYPEFDGEITAVIDYLIDRLMEEVGDVDE